ncbi:GIY-YIG nuclease family protein [Flavobacterium undicola]|uniref:GIY-YIG nuclease family protein n=1 Tax=Flavobacterium undicola TaxID=1932779 RepID=UPI001377DE99|nr:hypothetical protein [Flavobacterium undicola]MBA0882347.1 hypothetical protein [Flavobacterium undicola]
MKELKGKNEFTADTIKKLEDLITLRIKTPPSGQKSIRQKMRNLGFYGKDDWGITNFQISDLHSLIKTGLIKIISENFKPSSASTIVTKPIPTAKPKTPKSSPKSSTNIDKILESFKANCFDPKLDSEVKIDDNPGNYILCLRKNAKLPTIPISPTLTKFEGLNVIYTGIAGSSLRTRDFKQHFKGNNAGRSTLRKSLGVLFGYKLIPRDKEPNTGKTKFNMKDEQELSEWMLTNLIMFFLPTANFNNIEIKLINLFNPPLNIKDNHNNINADFRRLLSSLRTKKS